MKYPNEIEFNYKGRKVFIGYSPTSYMWVGHWNGNEYQNKVTGVFNRTPDEMVGDAKRGVRLCIDKEESKA